MMSKVRCCALILIGCWAVASTNGCIPPGSHPSFEKKRNEQFWREAMQSKPNDAKAHWFLGAALADENRLDEAEQAFRTVLKLQPDNASAHYELGNRLNMKGKTERSPRRMDGSFKNAQS